MTNPLGKCLDHVNENLEEMSREEAYWRVETRADLLVQAKLALAESSFRDGRAKDRADAKEQCTEIFNC